MRDIVFTPEAEAQLIELYGYIAFGAFQRSLPGSPMPSWHTAKAYGLFMRGA